MKNIGRKTTGLLAAAVAVQIILSLGIFAFAEDGNSAVPAPAPYAAEDGTADQRRADHGGAIYVSPDDQIKIENADYIAPDNSTYEINGGALRVRPQGPAKIENPDYIPPNYTGPNENPHGDHGGAIILDPNGLPLF